MQTYLSLDYGHRETLPEGHPDQLRTCDALVERFVEEYTEPGDRVLDVFAGYGTTLAAADRLGRVPYGVEFEADRTEYVRSRLDGAGEVRHGDALNLEGSWFPPCDLCFTSPPFMAEGMTENPFENYAGASTYDDYLDDVEAAFENVGSVLAPGGRVVVDASNMKHAGHVTTLAWDLGRRIRRVFDFEGEVVATWTAEEPHDRDGAFGYGYDHSYCLVFSKPTV